MQEIWFIHQFVLTILVAVGLSSFITWLLMEDEKEIPLMKMNRVKTNYKSGKNT